MSKAKLSKYLVFGLLYAFLVLEITATTGWLDPRSFFWPSTTGSFAGMWMAGRFFACYGYEYVVENKVLRGSQLLPLAYKDTLKERQALRVHYNKNDPEKSFFEPGFNSTVAFAMLFVIFLGFLLLFIPILSWISVSAIKDGHDKS